MRLAFLWLLIAALTTAGDPAKDPQPLSVTARPRTSLQSGRTAWYEVAIKNETDSDQIIDLGIVELTNYSFIGPRGMKGDAHVTTDHFGPSKCADWTAFALITPGASVTTLAKLQTPLEIEGRQQLSLGFDLWRVVDMKTCREDVTSAATKLTVQVAAP